MEDGQTPNERNQEKGWAPEFGPVTEAREIIGREKHGGKAKTEKRQVSKGALKSRRKGHSLGESF